MIEFLGISLAWETIAWVAAFAASEIIGTSKLKENSVAAVAKSLIDRMRPMRREDEKVARIKASIEALNEELKTIGK